MTGCTFSNDYKEDYNILENNSIRFIKSDASISFLINKDNTFYLLVLNGTTVTDTDYLIKIDNTKYNINYTEEYLLKDTLVLQDIIFKINDKIEIILNNKTFCIYLDRLNKDNFLECNFIYLYDINKDFYIELNDNMVLLYDSYTKFNYRFMYMLAKVWIDSYTIDNDCYTTITFEGDDYTVTSYKRRGKTIHKKLIS